MAPFTHLFSAIYRGYNNQLEFLLVLIVMSKGLQQGVSWAPTGSVGVHDPTDRGCFTPVFHWKGHVLAQMFLFGVGGLFFRGMLPFLP